MNPEQDAFGVLLLDHLHARAGVLVDERDDGFVEASFAAGYYFRPFRRWEPVERQALRYVRGRVLDAGTGAGRVALELQRRGHMVVGIDVSPLAAKVARRRGVKHVKVLSFDRLDESLGSFDTIAMFGNNFGLFGNTGRAPRLLRRLHRLTRDDGRIVAFSDDYSTTKRPENLAYQRLNRRRGRSPGQLRFRMRYRQYATPWLDYLFVTPGEMEQLLMGTGWRVHRFIHGRGSYFGAVIDKDL